MADGNVYSAPFRFFDFSKEVRDLLYSFLLVPENRHAVGSLHKRGKTATGCCDDCDVSGNQIDRHALSSDQALGILRNDGDHIEGESLSLHKTCVQDLCRPRNSGTDQLQTHQRQLARCPKDCEQGMHKPNRHYRQHYRRYRSSNIAKASKQLYQELTFLSTEYF
jgi:hypothetical protein